MMPDKALLAKNIAMQQKIASHLNELSSKVCQNSQEVFWANRLNSPMEEALRAASRALQAEWGHVRKVLGFYERQSDQLRERIALQERELRDLKRANERAESEAVDEAERQLRVEAFEGALSEHDRRQMREDSRRFLRSKSPDPEIELPVPVIYVNDRTSGNIHVLSDEIDRRARTTMQWAPWARRQRRSRRYEGFGGAR